MVAGGGFRERFMTDFCLTRRTLSDRRVLEKGEKRICRNFLSDLGTSTSFSCYQLIKKDGGGAAGGAGRIEPEGTFQVHIEGSNIRPLRPGGRKTP